MSTNLDRTLAEVIDSFGEQLQKQHEINKVFFMVINELLQNNLSSNMILETLISQSDDKISAEAMAEIKAASKYLTTGLSRHQLMSEAMLDAMQGKTEDLERKLNELFRRQDS